MSAKEQLMVQVALVSAHAASGVIAFVAGCVALRRRPAAAIYLWSLIALVGFVVAAIAVDWSSLEAASRIVFLGLIALGVFMVWRAIRASRLPVSAAYIDHVGF